MSAYIIPQVTLAIWVLWIIVYWQGGLKVLVDIRNSIRLSGYGEDTLALLVLSAASVLMMLTGVLNASTLLAPDAPVALQIVGLVMVVTGVVGTFYSRYYLGRFWTAEAAVQKNHELVQTGPYAAVRHPIYTFAVILYVGTALVFCHWWTLGATFMAFYAYVVKVRTEDQLLSQNIPSYSQYSEAVPHRLVPGLW